MKFSTIFDKIYYTWLTTLTYLLETPHMRWIFLRMINYIRLEIYQVIMTLACMTTIEYMDLLGVVAINDWIIFCRIYLLSLFGFWLSLGKDKITLDELLSSFWMLRENNGLLLNGFFAFKIQWAKSLHSLAKDGMVIVFVHSHGWRYC